MKIQYLSDLHIDYRPHKFRHNPECDVIVLAGDFCNGVTTKVENPTSYVRQFIENLTKLGKPIVCVAGNHDYYGRDVILQEKEVRQALGEGLPNVYVLNNEMVTIKGVRFFGSIFWPSLDWFGYDKHFSLPSPMAVNDFLIPRAITDFHVTKVNGELIDTSYMRNEFVRTRNLLTDLCQSGEGPDVVVSHFAPTKQSIAERYENNVINPFFCNNLFLGDFKNVQLWIHGHTHSVFDYMAAGVRVVCNPRGYPNEGVDYNRSAIVEIAER